MRLNSFLLAMLSLLVLGACRQETPLTSQPSAPAEAHLSSQNTGEQITLDLSALASPVDLNAAEREAVRALDFEYTPSKGTLKLVLDQNKATYRVLMALRPVGGSNITYSILDWKHVKDARKLYIHEVQVNLPAGLSYSANSWEAMLFLLPDGMTEAELQSKGYKLPYESSIATNAPVNMSSSQNIKLDLPYATDWTPLTKQQHAVNGDELTSHSFRFKPLGAVVTYKVTNNMDQAISLTGIKVVSNAVVPKANLDLSASTIAKHGASQRAAYFTDLGNENDIYASRTFSYTLPVTNLAKGQTATTGLVVWYPTTEAVSRTSFDYNDGTPATDLTGKIRFPEYFRSQEAKPAARYATTHVYAVGATKGSAAITKPNLDIVPIMGTDLQLASGKSYVMPCELYEQPNMQLGYFAKTPLEAHQGANGKYTFKLADEVGLNNSNVPLLSLWDELKDYVNLTDYSNPTMTPIRINGMDYMLPNNAYLRTMGLLSTNFVFFPNKAYSSNRGNGLPSVADKRGIWAREMSFIRNGALQAPEHMQIIAYSDVTNHTGTALMFRHDTLAAVAKRPVRSIDQAIYRVNANTIPTSTNEEVASFDVFAVYLGKYYVGDVEPFLDAKNWDSTQPNNILKNSVRRRFYVGGKYQVLYNTDGTSYNPKIRQFQGQLGAYWSLDRYQFQADYWGTYTAAPIMGSWGFYGDESGTWNGIFNNWTYRVAHPYSTTYQGD